MDIRDIIFPPRCSVCDGLLSPGEGLVHRQCAGKFRMVRGTVCFRCGTPLADEKREYCRSCSQGSVHVFTQNRSAFLYNNYMKDSLSRFKFHDRREYAKTYAAGIVKIHGRWIRDLHPDIMIPVPVHKKKYIKRGYNQAQVLADQLSLLTGIPVNARILLRTSETKAMKNLGPVQRAINLQKAFTADIRELNRAEKSCKLKKVLLVDDIYTTGATMDACSRALISAGIQEVYAVTAATGQNS